MFTVETVSGDEVLRAETLAEATVWARNALEDDPEVGTLLIWEDGVERRTVTFGPDADWQSVVVVLEPGEQIEPPTRVVAIREDGSYRTEPYDWAADNVYDLHDPKHPHFYSVHSDLWDSREGK